MGLRGELFSTRVMLQNRTYFFNVKENRMGDLYLNIVESKNKETSGFDRQSLILFADDLQEFLKGFDEALKILEKEVRDKRRSQGRPVIRNTPADDAERGGRRNGEGRPGRNVSEGFKPDSGRPASGRSVRVRSFSDKPSGIKPAGVKPAGGKFSNGKFNDKFADNNFSDKPRKGRPPKEGKRVVVKKR